MVKHILRFFFTFLAVIILSSTSVGQSLGLGLGSLSQLEDGDVKDGITILTDSKMRTAFNQYLGLLGSNVSDSKNPGFIEFNEQILNHPSKCFQDIAYRFYRSIKEEDHKRLIDGQTLLNRDSRSNLRTNLTEYSVSGLTYKQGWLWERALSMSGNNPAIALSLIGVCGHDDVKQTQKNRKLVSTKDYPKPQYDDLQILSVVNKRANEVQSHCEKNQNCPSENDLKTFWKSELNMENGVSCPSYGSAMFAPESLGTDYEISNDFKAWILKIQSNENTDQQIPLKPYHTFAAAVSSCRLISGGFSDELSEKIVNRSVNAYRSGRICNVINSYVGKQRMVYFVKNTSEQIQEKIQQIQKQPKLCFGPIIEKQNSELCLTKDHLGINEQTLNRLSEIDLKRIINRKISEAILAYAFSKSNLYSESNKCEGLQVSSAVHKFLKMVVENNELKNWCPIFDRSAGLCQMAHELAKTYLVDFEWTLRQHQLGLKLAKRYCKNLETDWSSEQLNTLSCRIKIN